MNRKKRTYLTAIFLAAVVPLTGILSGLPEASASASSLSVIEHIDTANNNGLIRSKYVDENGNEVKFEFLDLVELDDEEYVVLLPVSDEGEEDEGEVVILKLEDTDEDSDEESYVGVEDEEILNKVFAIFKEKYKDEFNFVDED